MTLSSRKSSEKKIFLTVNDKRVDKSYIVDQLILMIENIDDITVRCRCLEALDYIDYTSDKLFSDLENILISDSEDEIRMRAAKVIGKKFLARGVDPLAYAILHEEKYDNLLNVLVILEKLKVDEIHHILLEKLDSFDFIESIDFKEYRSSQLIEILINQLTLSCLKDKFSHLQYKVEKGYLTELDFSKVDNKILDWSYREKIQDHTEIHGIKYLTKIKRIIPFSLRWAIRNQFTMDCQVELLKVMGTFEKRSMKALLISQIKGITEPLFKGSIKELEDQETFSNLSVLNIVEIYLNYLVITFLKKKAPFLYFELKHGLVTILHIENVKLIKIPKFIELLSSLEWLRLHKCSIYEIPEFISNLKYLNTLELGYNKIDALPESFLNLKSLENLILKNNRMT